MATPRYCEIHSAVITDRGGEQVLFRLKDLSRVRWNRLLDNKSYANIEISGEACRAQNDMLQQIEPRRHELVIYRGDDRVWEGPIKRIRRGGNFVDIQANDVFDYLDARPLTQYWPGPENGGHPLMGDRIEQIILHEMATPYVIPGSSPAVSIPSWDGSSGAVVSPKINVLPHMEVTPGTVQTSTETFPFEMTVYEHLSNLAEGGLDYTTIGRKILIWDSAIDFGRTRTMTNADFNGNVEAVSEGTELVGVQHVVASRDGEEGEDALPPNSTENVGSYVRDMDYYGPWAKIHTRSEESGDASREVLNTQATRVSAGKNPVPLHVEVPSSSTLILDHLLTVNILVAGVSVPIIADLAGGAISTTQRLASIFFEETSAGEHISGTLVPGRAS